MAIYISEILYFASIYHFTKGHSLTFLCFILICLYFYILTPALGCADPSIPAHGFVERNGDHATINCFGSGDIVWEITCQSGQWIGFHGNCSTGAWKGLYISSTMNDVFTLDFLIFAEQNNNRKISNIWNRKFKIKSITEMFLMLGFLFHQ